MAKEFAKEFYDSDKWQKTRAFVIRKAGGLCQDCRKKGLYTPAQMVHHEILLTAENIGDPEVTLNPKHLVALCNECHAARHRKEKGRRYVVTESGDVICD